MNKKLTYATQFMLLFIVIHLSGCDPMSDLYYDTGTGQYMSKSQFEQLHPERNPSKGKETFRY